MKRLRRIQNMTKIIYNDTVSIKRSVAHGSMFVLLQNVTG